MQEKIELFDDVHMLELLQETPFPPSVLYMRGVPKGAPHNKRITIVGSRHCSQYAKQVVDEICASLEGQPVTIVSGLAFGVDTHAHVCALKYSLHTIAVVGSGLSDAVLYPKTNLRLAHKILKAGGALISEYEQSLRSQIWMFPARNRIMVGISDLVIIIEAKAKSGTLITARLATDYNRDLMVIPNSIYSTYAKGSNELIKHGAYVYTEPKDIFNLLGLDFPEQTKSKYTPTETEQIILDSIVSGNISIQSIVTAHAGSVSTAQVVQALLNLEIELVIKRIDGQYIIL
jgi:DNA processing protein